MSHFTEKAGHEAPALSALGDQRMTDLQLRRERKGRNVSPRQRMLPSREPGSVSAVGFTRAGWRATTTARPLWTQRSASGYIAAVAIAGGQLTAARPTAARSTSNASDASIPSLQLASQTNSAQWDIPTAERSGGCRIGIGRSGRIAAGGPLAIESAGVPELKLFVTVVAALAPLDGRVAAVTARDVAKPLADIATATVQQRARVLVVAG